MTPQAPTAPWYARYSKAIAGFLGALTPQAVFAILAETGHGADPWLNLGVTTVFAALAIARAPKNKP